MDVYYCYYTPSNNGRGGNAEILHEGEITTIDGIRVLDAVNLSKKSVVYTNYISYIATIYPGGEWLGEDYQQLSQKLPMEYHYDKVTFRSINALLGGNGEEILTKLYPDIPMTVAMREYLLQLAPEGKAQYTLAYYAKRDFYDPIKDELWEITKDNKNYYYSIDAYNDLRCGNKAGLLTKHSIYAENVAKRDIKSAYPSVLVTDNKFPVGYVSPSKIDNKCLKTHIIQMLQRGQWFKIVFAQKLDEFIDFFDEEYNKTALEYYDILDCAEEGILQKLLDSINVEVMLYTTQKTDYLPKVFRDRMVELFTKKESLDKKSIEYYFTKTKINIIYGKGMQSYDFNTIQDVQNHYKGRGDNYLKPEMSLHCTAKIRYMMHRAIRAIGKNDDYYHDTDGLAFNNTAENQAYFDNENVKILDNLEKAGYSRDLKLGIWANEGEFEELLVVGSKQYITRNGKEFDLTMCGITAEIKEQIVTKLRQYGLNALKKIKSTGLMLMYRILVVSDDKKYLFVQYNPDYVKFKELTNYGT